MAGGCFNFSSIHKTVCFQEEQADDETYEQFEERVVNKRAGQMFVSIKRRLRNNNILFSELVHGNNRKQVSFISGVFGFQRSVL